MNSSEDDDNPNALPNVVSFEDQQARDEPEPSGSGSRPSKTLKLASGWGMFMPASGSSTSKKPLSSKSSGKRPLLVCLDCFNSGKSLRTCGMSRDDNTTRTRHASSHHPNVGHKRLKFVSGSSPEGLKALRSLGFKGNLATVPASTSSTPAASISSTPAASISSTPAASTSSTLAASISSTPAASMTVITPSPTAMSNTSDMTADLSLPSSAAPLMTSAIYEDIDMAEDIPVLSKENPPKWAEEFLAGEHPPKWAAELLLGDTPPKWATKLFTQKSTGETGSAASSSRNIGDTNAAAAIAKSANILEVSMNIKSLQCTSLEDGSCLLKCIVCNSYLQSFLTKPDRIRASKTSGTLAAGLLVEAERAESLMTGVGQAWVRIKSRLKEHYAGLGKTGDIHQEAIKFEEEDKVRIRRGLQTTSNLIRAAILVCKFKSAFLHFEHALAFIASVGGDVGDIQHSRKSVPDLLKSIVSVINAREEQQLVTPLPSTGLPPFFWVTMDKSTPARITNQAVMICPMIRGQRRAIFVDARPVYERLLEDMERGRSHVLAKDVVSCIQRNYPAVDIKFCVGVSADGQYQARGFVEAIFQSLTPPASSLDWYAVVWDGAHWLDLVASDMLKTSGLLKLLLKRCGSFTSFLGRGRGNAMLHAVAADEGLKALNPKSYATTRFLSSNLSVVESVYRMYPVYIKALLEDGQLKRQENEEQDCSELEYLICGEDFAMDVCTSLDILEPLQKLMLLLQNMQRPCWNVVHWVPQLAAHYKSMLCEIESNSWIDVNTEKWPKTKEWHDEIQQKRFKGVRIVPGWRINRDESTVNQRLKWIAREVDDDCLVESRDLLNSLIKSLEARFSKAVPQLLHSLNSALALDKFVASCCGKFIPSVSQVTLDSCRIMPEKFEDLVRHVQELAPIRETAFTIFQRACFAFEWLLYSREEEARDARKDVFEIIGDGDSSSLNSPLQLKVSMAPVIFENCFVFVCEDGQEICAKLLESKLIEHIYCLKCFYDRLGTDFCSVLDLSLAKGGPEAVVESLYSVMANQKQTGQQSNEVLVNRTKIDWSLPPSVSAIPDTIEAAATKHLTTHKAPIMRFSGRKTHPQIASQVLRRLATDEGRLPIFS